MALEHIKMNQGHSIRGLPFVQPPQEIPAGLVAHGVGEIFRERACVAMTQWAIADRVANARADDLGNAEARLAQLTESQLKARLASALDEIERVNYANLANLIAGAATPAEINAARDQRDAAAVAYQVACEHEQACDEAMRAAARELAKAVAL
jgi:hypothetical protein